MGQTETSQNGNKNKQRINNSITPALERTADQATGGGGLNACYWYQIFALDSVVDKPQNIAMYHHRETI